MHVKSNHEGKRFECIKCDKSYTLRDSLRSHLDWHDLKEHGLKVRCKECQKTLSTRDTFDSHVRTQHKGLKFEPEFVMDEEVKEKEESCKPDDLNPKVFGQRKKLCLQLDNQ